MYHHRHCSSFDGDSFYYSCFLFSIVLYSDNARRRLASSSSLAVVTLTVVVGGENVPTKMTMSNGTKTNVLDELPFHSYDYDAIDSFCNLPPPHGDDNDDDVVSDVNCRRSCLGRLANHLYHASYVDVWIVDVGLRFVGRCVLCCVGVRCCDMDQSTRRKNGFLEIKAFLVPPPSALPDPAHHDVVA